MLLLFCLVQRETLLTTVLLGFCAVELDELMGWLV